MRKLGCILAALSVLALSACGGGSLSTGTNTGTHTGSSSGSSSSSGGINATVATVKVSSSAASVPADGSAGATITAQTLDANNNAVSGATVTFSTSTGSVLTNETTTTDVAGHATATVTDSGGAAGSTITVSATAGTAKGSANVMVVSNQQSVTLLVSSPSLPSNGSKPVTIQAIVRNASNQLVTGAVVSFSATSGGITPVTTTAGAAATPAVPAGTTDANGAAAAQLTPAGDPTNRTITVTATVGSTQATAAVA
ncbi:MAG TPA: Ig-like domain-containing protein, partial [Steroidobacteraceae bacterium]|nr:Ig-like domain-containing protein [Steroidobacteraceae bacterium]